MMARRPAARAACLLLTTLLAACGKADLGPVWFPLKEGTAITYAVTQTGGTLHPHDHRALRWVAAAELDELAWVPADRAWLPDLRDLLG